MEEDPCSPSLVLVGERASLPSVHVEDETSHQADQLRFRSRSQDHTASLMSNGSGQFTSLRRSPLYGTPGSRGDSGFGTPLYDETPASAKQPGQIGPNGCLGSSPEYSEPRRKLGVCSHDHADCTHNRNFASRALDELNPLEELLSFFKRAGKTHRASSLFSSDAPPKTHAYLPILMVFVVACTCVFTVLTLKHAVDRAAVQPDPAISAPRNAKYASLEHGHRRRRQALEESGKILPEDLVDEATGEQLTGKRAAMQYAHLAGRLQKTGAEVRAAAKEELYEAIAEELAKDEEEDESAEAKERKRRLLDKISRFGHVGTTKVHAQEEVNEVEQEEDEEVTEDDEIEDESEEETEADSDDEVEVARPKAEKLRESDELATNKTRKEPKVVKSDAKKTEKKAKKDAKKADKEPKEDAKPRIEKKDLSMKEGKKALKKKRSSDVSFRADDDGDNGDEDDPFRFFNNQKPERITG